VFSCYISVGKTRLDLLVISIGFLKYIDDSLRDSSFMTKPVIGANVFRTIVRDYAWGGHICSDLSIIAKSHEFGLSGPSTLSIYLTTL